MRPWMWLTPLLACAGSTGAIADDVLLADNGRSAYQIVIADQAPPSTRYAAEELQTYLEKISGARLLIVDDAAPIGENEILVGRSRRWESLGLTVDLSSLGKEGYVLRTVGRRLVIAGGEPRGTLYGVYGLLEETFGCRWFTPQIERVPKADRLALPKLDDRKVPVFEYRETYTWESFDATWMARNRLNGAGGRGRLFERQGIVPPSPPLDQRHGGCIRFGNGFFVHTFEHIVPPSRHFAEHPEYFALRSGKRNPAQLCCSNEAVIGLCTQAILDAMRDQPESTVFSLSQNDNQAYCQCDACQKLAQAEGTQMAPLLQLVNRVAAAVEKPFPDKVVETLAYQYTRRPPATLRPRANVVIRLCDIECCFAHPLDSGCTPRNAAFVADLQAWSKICNRLWIWDYTTNYRHYLLPMPNKRLLDDNIRLFAANHATGVFEQGTYDTFDSELAALKAYLIARFLWNPQADQEVATSEFLAAYYGPAAAAVRKYIDLVHDYAETGDVHVGIFSPATHPHLTPALLAQADKLWESAEAAAAGDAATLDRVRRCRMSVDYAIAEHGRAAAKTANDKRTPQQQEILSLARQRFAPFMQTFNASRLTRIREWQNVNKAEYRRVLATDLGITLDEAVGGRTEAEDWPQWKYDAGHSGNVPDRRVEGPLGLIGAVPLGDAVLTSPVVADGRVVIVDASGTAFAFDAVTLRPLWKHVADGGAANCNCVSSPAVAGGRVHYGTTAGQYYILDLATGKRIGRIDCGEPIFSSPVVHAGRVYFATLGSKIYALTPAGEVCWTWDFVERELKFSGDRWSGGDWLRHKQGRVTWRDQFCCPIDIAAHGRHVIVPAGGQVLWLEDAGNEARLTATAQIPAFSGKEQPGLFGLSVAADGAAYVQWHRRDNSGRVEILRQRDGQVQTDFVPGTQTSISLPGLMSFCGVSVRGEEVYRCRPQCGLEFCRHSPGMETPASLGGYPSIASPILLADSAVYGGLDGRLYVVPLAANGKAWSFATAFGQPITAPVAVCGGRIYFGCEDGYLYVVGPGGSAPLPREKLPLDRVRTPLTGDHTGPQDTWHTNYGDMANTNALPQGIKPPLRMAWIRRYEGTVKHLPVCGGGRLYTHTAEGQVFAVEQSTGRLLWRRYHPHVHLSFTAPLYINERLLLPQAGMKQSRLRCLDAATGDLLWEAPFSGSPSWSRQAPPVVWRNLAIYGFGSGRYAAQGTEKAFIFSGKPEPSPDGAQVMSWIYTHDNPYYPQDNRPLLCAWDVATGREVWRKDFSEFGCGGNDCGLCLMDDTLYYSTFFGYAAKRDGKPSASGLTAALDPQSGKALWTTTKHYVTAGCTLSGRDGRLYLGGYNRPNESTKDRHVWCLDARDGSLVWQSEPVLSSVNVVSVGPRFLFSNASGKDGHLFDRETGKIVSRFNFAYACTRFTLSEPYLLGANMDLVDLADGNKLVWTGPAIEPRECLGSVASNGRLFYTAQASGLQACLTSAADASPGRPSSGRR